MARFLFKNGHHNYMYDNEIGHDVHKLHLLTNVGSMLNMTYWKGLCAHLKGKITLDMTSYDCYMPIPIRKLDIYNTRDVQLGNL